MASVCLPDLNQLARREAGCRANSSAGSSPPQRLAGRAQRALNGPGGQAEVAGQARKRHHLFFGRRRPGRRRVLLARRGGRLVGGRGERNGRMQVIPPQLLERLPAREKRQRPLGHLERFHRAFHRVLFQCKRPVR